MEKSLPQTLTGKSLKKYEKQINGELLNLTTNQRHASWNNSLSFFCFFFSVHQTGLLNINSQCGWLYRRIDRYSHSPLEEMSVGVTLWKTKFMFLDTIILSWRVYTNIRGKFMCEDTQCGFVYLSWKLEASWISCDSRIVTSCHSWLYDH